MADSLPQEWGKQGRSVRLPWIDIARGLALLAMASYHFSWDLANARLVAWGVASDPLWRAYAMAIAASFLFLSGLSFRLASRDAFDPFRYGARLARLTLAAAAVSVATYVVFPDAWVFFGILHMMLVASLVAPALVRLPSPVLIILAMVALALPHYARSPAFDGQAWGFLGLAETPPVSNDLVPVLPWIAPYLLGLALGGWVADTVGARPAATSRPARLLAGLGRYSLVFYLVHQPLLFGLAEGLAAVLPVDPAVNRASFVSDCRIEYERYGATADMSARFCGCVATSVDDTGIWDSRAPDPTTGALLSIAVQTCQSAPGDDLPGLPGTD